MIRQTEIVRSCSPADIRIARKETLLYLGYKNTEPTAEIESLIEECTAEFLPAAAYKACYERLPISFGNEPVIHLGFADVQSRSLWKNLAGCTEIILLAATAGPGVDRLIQRYSVVSPGKALVFQALGAAAVESFLDFLCTEFANELASEALYIRPRFSPGYGDFPLSCQKDLFRFLDCPRKAGISLTDNLLMTPTKSVSAVIGLSKTNTKCIPAGCESCPKADCAFRRT